VRLTFGHRQAKRKGALYSHFIKLKIETRLHGEHGFYGEGIRATKYRINLGRQCNYGLRTKEWRG